MKLSISALALIGPLLLLLIQIALYRWTRQFIWSSFPKQKTRQLFLVILGVLCVCANMPLLVMIVTALMSDNSPFSASETLGPLARYLLYLMVVWQLGSIVSFFVIICMKGLRWLLKALGVTETTAPPTKALPIDMSRRQFLRNAGVGLATLPFAASTYGVFVASQEFKIERIRLALPRLPEGLNGLTLVQLSDIHVGLFMNQHRLEEYVKIVNQLEPDLALITGDFVSVSNKYVLPTVKALSQLRSRFGVFGSIGNHELYTDAVPLLIEGFARNNMKILFNENAYVHTNGAKLNLVGIEYVSQSVRIFDSAIAGIPLDGPTILLSHQPNVFPKAAERGIDLTLSGHTHGGQIKFEFLGMDVSPARLITPYPEGLFELGESKLYVNRGLGTTGPPVRINAVPEITHITVVSGQGSVNS